MKYLLFLFLISTSATAGVVIKQDPFEAPHGHFFRGTGVSCTATKNTTTNCDYKLTETRKINGLHLFLDNHCWSDTLKLQVVDVDGAYYPAGTVLDEFGTDWHVDPAVCSQGKEIMSYPAQVLINLYLRIVYTSTCNVNDVKMNINYYLHKVP